MPDPVAVARVCGKWDLPFYFPLAGEGERSTHARSYLHYVKEHTPLVAAKAVATEWLLSGQPDFRSAVEYFGGAGVVSTILRGMFRLADHTIYEIDGGCIDHLEAAFGKGGEVLVVRKDARVAVTQRSADLALLDFPNFTALSLKDWGRCFDSLFLMGPKMVVLTDTALSYFPVHKKKYGVFFGRTVSSLNDYLHGISSWFKDRYGYRVTRAAQRGKNAVYLLITPSARDGAIVRSDFLVGPQTEKGFVWVK